MEIGTVQQVDIDEQMREAYLDYAMSVIVSRALPDARDGLKPVHRRILYSMWEEGNRARSRFLKCGKTVGGLLIFPRAAADETHLAYIGNPLP